MVSPRSIHMPAYVSCQGSEVVPKSEAYLELMIPRLSEAVPMGVFAVTSIFLVGSSPLIIPACPFVYRNYRFVWSGGFLSEGCGAFEV
jgi:hypothetical protein